MDANQVHLRELADACVLASAETRDADAAAELLRISYRILRLADPTLPAQEDEDDIPEFGCRQVFGRA
jgi:hypothetical protein